MTDLPDISTYSNVAYEMVKQRTESGEVGEDGTGSSSEDGIYYSTVSQATNSHTRPTPQEHERPASRPPATRPPAPTVPGYMSVSGMARVSKVETVEVADYDYISV